eukprot:CAMPEP_0197438748 /NCGR_PEP_ID=MMETSP1175-20131217/5658_1 /TAXON_ID=1003142 /ORGANISM="Triceratium dubium, Strain CCMP147" /LENGTH=128 /DNA_ID=CAMNT_0042968541 /DNA_START=1 /DNA_END=384 /DNA_ORIENTATION=+
MKLSLIIALVRISSGATITTAKENEVGLGTRRTTEDDSNVAKAIDAFQLLPPEESFVQPFPSIDSFSSSDYSTKFDLTCKEAEENVWFNAMRRTVQECVLVGHHLVLNQGTQPFDSLHELSNLASLTL